MSADCVRRYRHREDELKKLNEFVRNEDHPSITQLSNGWCYFVVHRTLDHMLHL